MQFVHTLVSRVIELDGETHHDLWMEYEDYLADSARIARAEKRKAKAKKKG